MMFQNKSGHNWNQVYCHHCLWKHVDKYNWSHCSPWQWSHYYIFWKCLPYSDNFDPWVWHNLHKCTCLHIMKVSMPFQKYSCFRCFLWPNKQVVQRNLCLCRDFGVTNSSSQIRTSMSSRTKGVISYMRF